MFLKRVTITGFKSFAGKTVLDLEPGITAVVGPNGSGKSNLADAVRWALGEQSKGRLRLADREEVIFAGTERRAKASFAEVTLSFNNEDGAFPLELSEVEISRRLYRSGETDYRLGRRSVRLADIQALIAGAGFGLGSYAVIGQGMIDNLLLSSPAERKLLFDEAAGIRGPELSREAALRKLAATQANLTRLRDIAAEIAPRLSALQNPATTAAELAKLERRVGELKSAIVSAGAARWADLRRTTSAELEVVAASLSRLKTAEARLQSHFEAASAEADAARAEQAKLQESLRTLEQDRDRLGSALTQQRAALAAADERHRGLKDLRDRSSSAQAALAAADERRHDLKAELASNAEAAGRARTAVERAGHDVTAAQAELVALRKSTQESTRDQYLDHALQILKTLAVNLRSADTPVEEIRLLVHKAGRLLSHATRSNAAELLAGLKSAQKRLEAAMSRRETAVEHQTNVTITGRSLEIDLAHQAEAATQAKARLAEAEAALATAEAGAAARTALATEVRRLDADFAATATRLERERARVHALTAASTAGPDRVKLAAALERARYDTASAETEHKHLVARLAEAEAGLAAVAAQAKGWGIEVPARPAPAGNSPESLSAELVRTEALLEARTAAGRDQAAEYEEVNSRHAELTAQIADLESAGADLEQVITELDGLIRTRFKDNFKALAAQFSDYFARLFGGGSASLDLTEADDGSYGIAIKASPKGKRLSSIAALSGGERALAGVALLAAILRVNPSPFVVLDEIDAALDEANSGRLAEILAELAERSQLIVITHNRQTMKAAGVLFGVTSTPHQASHLISMRLEEAAALAAR